MGWLALVAGLAMAGCGWGGGRPSADSPSILLVTIDTLRADRLSSYGYPLETSPNLDRLAVRGVRFEYALAPSSSTAPTHASIFTGHQPSEHSIGAFNSQFALDEQWPTLAGTLREAGYATGAIVSNPLLGRALGLGRGFGYYYDDTRGEGRFLAKGPEARRSVDRALEWLDDAPREPFFLWLHLQDTHGPYAPAPGWVCPLAANEQWPATPLPLGRDASGWGAIPSYQIWDAARSVRRYAHRYDCELADLDAQLGRLLARFSYDPELRDALVVVTADHGEAFGEDGFWFAHGHGVGLDQVRVPLIMAGAGLPRGTVVTRPVGLTALFASLLEVAGVALPGDVSASSLLDVVAGGDGESEPAFVESLNQVGVAQGGVFLRRDLHEPGDREFWRGGNPNSGGSYWEPLGGRRVDALSAELGSAGVASPGVERLAAALDEYAERALRERRSRRGSRPALELSPEQQAALRELGYAQ